MPDRSASESMSDNPQTFRSHGGHLVYPEIIVFRGVIYVVSTGFAKEGELVTVFSEEVAVIGDFYVFYSADCDFRSLFEFDRGIENARIRGELGSVHGYFEYIADYTHFECQGIERVLFNKYRRI